MPVASRCKRKKGRRRAWFRLKLTGRKAFKGPPNYIQLSLTEEEREKKEKKIMLPTERTEVQRQNVEKDLAKRTDGDKEPADRGGRRKDLAHPSGGGEICHSHNVPGTTTSNRFMGGGEKKATRSS